MQNGIQNIAVFGDSILKGVVTGTSSGKAFDVIEEDSLTLASRELGLTIQNFSAFGNVITKGLRTLRGKLEKGLAADAVIIESGGNDCDHDWIAMTKDPSAPAHSRVPLDDFLQTLDQMVGLVRQHGMTPVVTTMPPLVIERWFDNICKNASRDVILSFCKSHVMNLYRAHELYSTSIAQYALTHGVQLVDLRAHLLRLDDYEDYMCLDGIHPNPRGYRHLSAIWVQELPKLRKE